MTLKICNQSLLLQINNQTKYKLKLLILNPNNKRKNYQQKYGIKINKDTLIEIYMINMEEEKEMIKRKINKKIYILNGNKNQD